MADAERAGLRLAIFGRNIALLPVAIWIGLAGNYPGSLLGVLLIAAFFGLGVLWLWLVRSGKERPWHRYVLFTIDIAALATAALLLPVSVGDDLPQIFVFRGFGIVFVFIFLAVAALTLMPGLLLWVGFVIVAAIWTVFGIIVSGMETTVSWGDLPPGPTAEEFYAILFSPDFIGLGSRVNETLVILSVAVLLSLTVHRARRVVRQQAQAERERRRIFEVFGQYVPTEVAAEILATPDALSPQNRDATVLFCDVEGFTSFAETRAPAAVLGALNGLFTEVTEAITEEGGVAVSFVGDGVLATFNAPRPCADHAACGLRAGRAILKRVEQGTADGVRLNVRIGIATGPVAAGSVGGTGRQTYTVYGDTVNVAQRLEVLNKELGTRLLASRTVFQDAGTPSGYRELPSVTVRNRSEPLSVVTLA